MKNDPSSEVTRSKKDIRKRNLQIGGGILLVLLGVAAYAAVKSGNVAYEHHVIEPTPE